MRVAPLCLALLLTGCATPYQPAGLLTGGYSETKLAPDSYQIFAETESLERTGQMLDLRAAELTLESGYRKFAVVDRVVNNEHRTHYIPGYTSYGGGLRAAPMVVPPRMETVTVAKGKMTIKMLKGSESGAGKGHRRCCGPRAASAAARRPQIGSCVAPHSFRAWFRKSIDTRIVA